MDGSTPGLCVPHCLPEFAQVHVHCICVAIQPSHPLLPSSPSPTAIRGVQTETMVSHNFTRIRMAAIKKKKKGKNEKTQTIASIDKHVEKLKPLCAVGGNKKCCLFLNIGPVGKPDVAVPAPAQNDCLTFFSFPITFPHAPHASNHPASSSCKYPKALAFQEVDLR